MFSISLHVTKQRRTYFHLRSKLTRSNTKMFAHLFYLWTVILVFCLNSKNYAVNGSLSGLYIDNGIGQTVMSESIPQDDIQEMKYEISEALGLPSRFRHNHIHPSLR